ncbi:DUF2189 domain-containing protein [Thioalkalivibrio sp. AKL17]|uniref:DUF2189 domain-containing protein n=1 Tax=Thioalkalivibrio sp. AKL17 TaxID=1158160 RepID=UPI00036A8F08|nr:DUF2189 domain-containing protein [Thioalkalivibrio sp. AKL17]
MISLIQRRYPDDLSEIRPRHGYEEATPGVRRIEAGRPLRWLSAGWNDLRHAPAGLLHGLMVTAIGGVIMGVLWSWPWAGVAALTGFLLVGPVLATGLNGLARSIERGETVGLRSGFGALEATGGAIWAFAALLASIFLAWTAFAWLWMGVLNVGHAGLLGPLHEALPVLLGSTSGLISLAGLVVAGAALAVVVLALSVVTIPTLLDRRTGLMTAMGTSLKALRTSPAATLIWAALITVLFAVSVATALLALIVVFPWLGYAMWHAYRDLVEPPEEAAPTT